MKSIRRARWLALLCPALALAQSSRDSADVRIVESARPSRSAEKAWRVDAQPFLDIGLARTDPRYGVAGAAGVVRLASGRIVVANSGTSTLRFYDSTGMYLRSTGRRGDAPGEFRDLLGLALLDGDTLATIDRRGITLLTADGRFVREGVKRGIRGARDVNGILDERTGKVTPLRYIGVGALFGDGSYIGFDNTAPDQRTDRVGRWLDSMTMYHVSANGSRTDSIAHFPVGERARSAESRRAEHVVFGPTLHYAAAGRAFYAGYPARNEIGYYASSGVLQRVVRWTALRHPVLPAHVTAFKAALRAQPGEDGNPAPGALRAHWERLIAEMTFTDTFPTYAALRVDRAGHLWVEHHAPWMDIRSTIGPRNLHASPTFWDVFDPHGQWLTTVRLPAGFSVFDIGTDYVAGVWRGADDVGHVRFYHLIKP
jgi:hypothetical protein